ncbi:MAG: 50S ribosomal protein L29 [Holosporaceae bacterium]|jgi:hypothetical protein|nr:50S ribosomal protein L29 [Holosporaceae bacterium]
MDELKGTRIGQGEVDSAKHELMRIRFRRVLGETVAPHVVKKARKNVAKCIRDRDCGDSKNG